MSLAIPPLLLTGIFILLMAAASWLLPQFTVVLPANDLFALIFIVAGTGFCAVAIVIFRQAKTTANPMKPEQTSQLITNGVYRVSRNPMYVGFLFLIISWGVHSTNLLNLLIFPPLFVAYMNRFQIAPEEEALRQKFGKDFNSYCSAVRRWL